MQLYVNGEIVQSVDLTQASSGTGVPGSGTGTQLNSNSSGFVTLSQTGSAVQSTGVSFETFQHRALVSFKLVWPIKETVGIMQELYMIRDPQV